MRLCCTVAVLLVLPASPPALARPDGIVFTERFNNVAECITRSGAEGQCVAITQCARYQTREDILRDRPVPCHYRGRMPIICCPSTPTGDVDIVGPIRNTTLEPIEQCGNAERQIVSLARRRRETAPTPPADPEEPLVVEVAALPDFGTDEVVSGVTAQLGKWPWMALLGSVNRQPRWFCGGALISQQYVLTAAHCLVEPAESLVVRLGEYDLLRDLEVQHQEVGVARAVRHPQYRRGQNDIALLELTLAVNFTDSVRPVCLPAAGADFQGELADLAGWGVTEFNNRSSIPTTLQEVTLRVSDEQLCEEAFRQTAAFNFKFPGGFQGTKLCGVDPDGGSRDACSGDSGGPLVHRSGETGLYQLIGVVSTGVGCGNPDFPGIYTKVSAYLSWIREVAFSQQQT